MLFNSLEYAIFLPIVFVLYWFVFNRNLKSQNIFVIAASYIFYGWWNWRFLILIAITSFCSWGSGILMNKIRKRKLVAIINITLNFLILFVFKYYNFFVSSFASLFHEGDSNRLLLNVILPVGISFYTFQALSYTIDVYRRKIKPTTNIVQFFAFVSFFPQLVAGPIERATNLLPQFEKPRSFDYGIVVDGMRQLLWGLFKKIAVADLCAKNVDLVFHIYKNQDGCTLLLTAILFTFQIYADFSGYSDIAIGTSKLFGIKLMRNFNVPYFSRNIAEFWRRWHISLTSWFRDYVYIPLGGSKCSKAKTIRNVLIVFLLSGLWHGANWTYIVWGAYNAVLYLILMFIGRHRRYSDVVADEGMLPSIKEVGQMFLTFILALVGWVIFRSESLANAIEYFGIMMQWGTLRACYRFFVQVDIWQTSWLIIFMLIVEWLQRKEEHGLDLRRYKHSWLRHAIYYVVIILILYFADDPQAFVYFQF